MKRLYFTPAIRIHAIRAENVIATSSLRVNDESTNRMESRTRDDDFKEYEDSH